MTRDVGRVGRILIGTPSGVRTTVTAGRVRGDDYASGPGRFTNDPAVLDRDAIAFLFLIVVLMVRPQGLFAAK